MVCADPGLLIVGRICGVFGIRGWFKVHSYTHPRENIFDYTPWRLNIDQKWACYELAGARQHGKGLIAALRGWTDRDEVGELVGQEIAIQRQQLPKVAPDEYYWADLLEMDVVNTCGVALGKVVRLLPTGANDVLVVRGERERLIPFVKGIYVMAVHGNARQIEVAWDPED